MVLLVVDNTLMCSALSAFVFHKRARTISFSLYAYALSYAYYVHVFAFMQEQRWLCLRLLPSRFNFVEYRLHSAEPSKLDSALICTI